MGVTESYLKETSVTNLRVVASQLNPLDKKAFGIIYCIYQSQMIWKEI